MQSRLVGQVADILAYRGVDRVEIERVVDELSVNDVEVRVIAVRDVTEAGGRPLSIQISSNSLNLHVRMTGLGFNRRLKYKMPPDPRPPRDF